jgi:hypothetical protein
MIDPSNFQLYKALHQERQQAAAEARHWRATAVAAPSPIARLRQAIGTRLANLGQRLQTSTVQRETVRNSGVHH